MTGPIPGGMFLTYLHVEQQHGGGHDEERHDDGGDHPFGAGVRLVVGFPDGLNTHLGSVTQGVPR